MVDFGAMERSFSLVGIHGRMFQQWRIISFLAPWFRFVLFHLSIAFVALSPLCPFGIVPQMPGPEQEKPAISHHPFALWTNPRIKVMLGLPIVVLCGARVA